MTTSQYLTAWALYGAAAIGCLIVWWRLTKPLNATFASWLRLIVAALLLTPGYAGPDQIWLSPAMFSIAFEVLNDGPQGLTLNGLILMVTTTLALIAKALFFRKPLRLSMFSSEKSDKPQHQTRQHPSSSPPLEPSLGGEKVIRYREHKTSSSQVYEKGRIEPHIS